MRVGVLASGAGTNLQAILDRVHGRDGVEVVGVGSDKPDAQALERAALARRRDRACSRAPTYRGPRGARRSRWPTGCRAAASSSSCSRATCSCSTPRSCARFPARVINVHPALLPAFPGIRAVEQALDYGVKVFGVTVHFVDEGVDTGRIILQRAVELPARHRGRTRCATRCARSSTTCCARRSALIARDAVRLDPDHPRRVLVAP